MTRFARGHLKDRARIAVYNQARGGTDQKPSYSPGDPVPCRVIFTSTRDVLKGKGVGQSDVKIEFAARRTIADRDRILVEREKGTAYSPAKVYAIVGNIESTPSKKVARCKLINAGSLK